MSEIEKARIVEENQTHVLQKIAVLIGWNIYRDAGSNPRDISHSLQFQTCMFSKNPHQPFSPVPNIHVSKKSTSAILSSPKHACFQKIHISHSLQSQTCMFPKKPHQPFSPVLNMHVSKKSTSAILSSPKHACFQKNHISHSLQS